MRSTSHRPTRAAYRPGLVLAVIGALVVQLAVVSSATADTFDVLFDFEDGIDGWSAPEWLSEADEFGAGTSPARHSSERAVSAEHSLSLTATFPGNAWTAAGAVHDLGEAFSVTGEIRVHVWVDQPGLTADVAFGNAWRQPASAVPLDAGAWTEVVFDAASAYPQPVNDSTQVVLRVIGDNPASDTPATIFFDDLTFTTAEPFEVEGFDGTVRFDFETGTDGFYGPDWLDFVGPPFQDDTRSASGDHSLALPVAFTAGTWNQVGVARTLDDLDLDLFRSVTFHLYAPVDGLQARFQFNDPWTEPAAMRSLSQGWNEVTYQLNPASLDFPGGPPDANEFLLMVIGNGLPEAHAGHVWFDAVEFTPAPEPIVFDFEDGVDGWMLPTWLQANDTSGSITQSTEHAIDGSDHSLAFPVRMNAGSGWEQAGVGFRFIDPPLGLLSYDEVIFHVYAPVAGLQADLIFNDPWNPPTGLRQLQQGWNELSYDISAGSTDWPGGIASANEFLIRVVGSNLSTSYLGDIWIDDIAFLPGTAPTLQVLAPQPNAELSVAEGEHFAIEASAIPQGDRALEAVTWASDGQSGALAWDGSTGTWRGEWDLWTEGEGVTNLAVTATDDAGESITWRAGVLVRNSELEVDILAPEFDEQVAGDLTVIASVTPDSRYELEDVRLSTLEHDLDIAMTSDGGGQWSATIDTSGLDDGIETFVVTASDAAFSVRDLSHVIIRNDPPAWEFVEVEGTSFVHAGEPFRFIGWNEYELFTMPENFGRHQVSNLDQTIYGEVLLPGTQLDWEEQIDRQMLEAARHGQTVLRTWAFNRNDEDSAFQRPTGGGNWEYVEETFRRLDYVVDSAERHGIRVILTLDNYWEDYGGIAAAASWLGLDNKLQFFTDPAAISLYQDYAENLITRTNTVNGRVYGEDPTVFAWELMNEPRTDCAADPTPERRYCDPTGEVARQWFADQATFIRDLAPDHLVSPGGEAHGWIPTPGGGLQFGNADGGNDNIPFYDMDVDGIDFFTFHPYPNAWWAGLTKQQTREMTQSLTRMAVERGKPVVMAEYGIHRSEPVGTDDGGFLDPGDPGYQEERVDHYDMMLDACYAYGCAGSNVWMLADWSDRDLNINLYKPYADAVRDRPLVETLAAWADRLEDAEVQVVEPGCDVTYTVHGEWPGGFNAQVWVENTGTDPIDGWELGWWFEGDQDVANLWGGSHDRDRSRITVANLGWNQRIEPGGRLTLGFIGSTGGDNPTPKVFWVNGEICTVGSEHPAPGKSGNAPGRTDAAPGRGGR